MYIQHFCILAHFWSLLCAAALLFRRFVMQNLVKLYRNLYRNINYIYFIYIKYYKECRNLAWKPVSWPCCRAEQLLLEATSSCGLSSEKGGEQRGKAKGDKVLLVFAVQAHKMFILFLFFSLFFWVKRSRKVWHFSSLCFVSFCCLVS